MFPLELAGLERPMFSIRPLTLATLFILVCGCKVQVSVDDGGRVESTSGAYICTVNQSCVIDVSDTNFDETFNAIPDPGYTFAAWKREANFCRGKSGPCRLFTSLFPGTPLMGFLESDDTYYLEPDFAKSNLWAQGSDMLEAGGAISSCTVKGIVYVFGIGWGQSGVPNGAAKYDSVNDQWVQLPDMPERQGWASVGVVNGKCYVIGGAPSFGGVATTAVFEFDPKNESWTSKAPLPERRTLASAAVVGKKIYVIGGGDRDSFFPTIRASVAIYDPATDGWSEGAAMPTPRFLLAAAALNGRVYALGGTAGENETYSKVVERYDPSTNSWSKAASMINGKRGHSANILRGRIYTVGGVVMGLGLSGLVESFDPKTGQWISRTDLSTARWAHGSQKVDGHIIAFGGFSSSTDPSAPSVPTTEIYTD